MISTSIRKTLVSVAMGTLVFVLPKSTAAQNQPVAAPATQAASQPAPNFASQSLDSAPADDSAQANQPTSLGDLARMVRAKKETEPKATRVFNDENLPHNGGGISVVGNGGGSGGGSASGSKMTLLDFWASWCGPCRQSVPDLKALQQAYGSDQLAVVSVNEDKNENAGRSFASDNGMSWEVDYDPTGQTSRQYDVHALPTFILVDANGKEVQRFVGEDPSVPLAGRIAPFMPKTLNAGL